MTAPQAARHFSAVSNLSGLQFEALSVANVYAGPDEGYEESQASVDLGATLARIERHRAEAIRASPSAQAQYEAYVVAVLDACAWPNISGAEIIAIHKRVTRRGVKNEIPPPWGLARLIVFLDEDQYEVRNPTGLPVRFNSLGRADPYNRDIRGASLSQHRVYTARDRVLVGGTVAQLAELDRRNARRRRTISAPARAAIARLLRDYPREIGAVLSGSVLGEPFSRSGLGYNGATCSMAGGRGRYGTFNHKDGRGIDVAWRG